MISLRSYCVIVVALFAVWKTTTAVAVLQVNCTSSGTQCDVIANTTCNDTVGKCQCVAGYEKAINQNTCAKVVPTPTCTEGSPCIGQANSVCRSGTCTCTAGFVMKGSVCTKDAPATICTEGSPCTGQVNSLCSGGMCICKAGFVMKANTCTKDAPASTCIEGSPCLGQANSLCSGGTCICTAGFVMKANTCTKAVSGTTCTASGKQCDVIDNAECDGTNCKCRSGYTMKVDVCAAENAAPSMELGRVALPLTIIIFTLLKKLF